MFFELRTDANLGVCQLESSVLDVLINQLFNRLQNNGHIVEEHQIYVVQFETNCYYYQNIVGPLDLQTQ